LPQNPLIFPKVVYPEVEYQVFQKEAKLLINRLIKAYDYYDSKQWVSESGKELEPQDVKAAQGLDYEPTLMKVDLAKWLVNRQAAFMFERGLAFSVPVEQIDDPVDMVKPDYEQSKKQKTETRKAFAREQLCYAMLKQNNLNLKVLTAAKDYLVGGNVGLKIHFNENRGMRFIFRPRLEVWPVYDDDDIDVLNKLHFIAWLDDETLWKQSYWMDEGTGTCRMNEKTYDRELKIKDEIQGDTDTGLPFIPGEMFPRGALTGETEGRSLMLELLNLNEEYKKKLSDNADSLRFGMFAIKVLINCTEEIAKKCDIAPNALWAIISESIEEGVRADVKTLEHEFSYKDAYEAHMDRLERLMHKFADVPNLTPELIKGLGQMSGFAIKLLYGPLISITNQNMMVWKPKLNRIFGMALFMLNKYRNIATRFYDPQLLRDARLDEINMGNIDSVVEVKTFIPLPENEEELIKIETQKIGALLESRKGAMDNLGVENPEAKMAEIMNERQQIQEQQYGAMDKNQQQNINNTDPEDEE